jgi:hypothetical protein
MTADQKVYCTSFASSIPPTFAPYPQHIEFPLVLQLNQLHSPFHLESKKRNEFAILMVIV